MTCCNWTCRCVCHLHDEVSTEPDQGLQHVLEGHIDAETVLVCKTHTHTLTWTQEYSVGQVRQSELQHAQLAFYIQIEITSEIVYGVTNLAQSQEVYPFCRTLCKITFQGYQAYQNTG